MADPTNIDPRSAPLLNLNPTAAAAAAAANTREQSQTAAAAAAASASPLAKLDTANLGIPAVHGISNTNLLPPQLGGPAAPVPVVPQTMPVPTAPAAITPALTKPQNPVNVPTAPAPTTAATALGASLASFASGLQSYSDTLSKTPDPNAGGAPSDTGGGNGLSDILKNILTLNGKIGTKGAETERINGELGIDEKTQKVADLTAQYNSRAEYYDHKIQDAQKNNPNGKSADAIQQDVDGLTRQKNSELADIAIQQSAASGNLKVATDLSKQKIDAEFEPVQAQIDNMKTYYELSSNDMTESEKQDAQAAITEKQSALDEEKQKRLDLYAEQIKQSDPQYQATLAKTLNGSDGGTLAERQANAVSQFSSAFVPGATMPNGIPTLDSDGYITPEAWKAAINDAPGEGLSREEFIKAFGAQIATPDGKVSTKYGLTPTEIKLITGALPDGS